MKRPVPSHHGHASCEGDPPRFEITWPVPRQAEHSGGSGVAAGSSAAMARARVTDVDRSSSRPSPLLGSHFRADRASMAPAWKDESGWTLPEMLLGLLLSLGI